MTTEEKDLSNNLLGNVSHSDLTMIRNEFLIHIKKLEKDISKKIEEQNKIISTSINLINSKINEFSKNNSSLIETNANIIVKLDKLEDIENFKKKAESQLITHEIKLSNVIKDLTESKFKYDKIFIDNLTVPGFIGPQCQYKNLSDYLLYNIQIINKLTKSREKMKKNLSDLNHHFQNMNKDFSINVSSINQSCNDYCDQKTVLLENELKNEILNMNGKIMDVRMQYAKDTLNFEKKINEMKSQFDNMLLFFNDIESKFKEKISWINNINNENQDNKNDDNKNNDNKNDDNKKYINKNEDNENDNKNDDNKNYDNKKDDDENDKKNIIVNNKKNMIINEKNIKNNNNKKNENKIKDDNDKKMMIQNYDYNDKKNIIINENNINNDINKNNININENNINNDNNKNNIIINENNIKNDTNKKNMIVNENDDYNDNNKENIIINENKINNDNYKKNFVINANYDYNDLKTHLNKKYEDLNEEIKKVKSDFSNIFEEIKSMKQILVDENFKKNDNNFIYKYDFKKEKKESFDSDKIENIDYENYYNKKINVETEKVRT